MKPNLQDLINALKLSWSADTAFDADDWSKDNPARGQCVVSALVTQDYLGGDLARYDIDEGTLHETHYVNNLAGVIVDTTASQYNTPVNMRMRPVELKGYKTIREKRLADVSTRKRYEILKGRVDQLLKLATYKDERLAGKYRHYKGNEYELLGFGTHTENEEKMVIYKALYAPYEIWLRPYDMFFSTVEIDGKVIPRFEKIED